MILLHAVAFLFCLQCMAGAVLGQTITTSLSDELLTLSCESSSSTDNELYQWSETELPEEESIYVVGSTGVVTNYTDPKYSNFRTDVSSYPTSVPLIIDDILPEDEGVYMCTAVVAAYRISYDVRVEVPATVVIKNGSVDVESLTVTVGESYAITCTATGARSRNELTLVWEPPLEGGTVVEQPDDELTDYTITSTYTPQKEDSSIRCQLTGYVKEDEIKDLVVDSISLTVQYVPECSLTVNTVEGDCRTVTLTCECIAVPETTEYFFYNGSSLRSNTVTNTIDVNVDYDTTSEFSCQASNDVGMGKQSKQENHTCEEGTTALPTTILPTEFTSSTPDSNTAATVTTPSISTKEDGTPTGTKGPPVGLIVGLSVGIPFLIIILVLVIWFLKNRDGDSDKNKPDPPQNDDAVITMNASTTSSLAPLYGEVKKEKKKKSSPNDDTSNTMPLYGEVKKDRKKKSDDSVNDFGNKETPAVYAVPDKNKKSDKPDGNGAGPESDMPTYADVKKPPQPTAAPRTSQNVPDDQPMQELQYADLDHGKQPPTNEIRKPQDEPTEYATVQSVIV